MAVTVRHGLSHRLTVEGRLPLQWRGAGSLDGVIDWWHRATGLPDNGRPLFPSHEFVIDGRGDDGRPVAWTGRAGTGLGNGEIALAFAAGRREAWTLSLVGRATLPTATGPFHSAAPDVGVQVAAARPLGPRGDLYVGVGAVRFAEAQRDGIRYRRERAHGLLGLEERLGQRVSAVVQVEGASRLVTNLSAYPGFTTYLTVGLKADLLGARTSLAVVEAVGGLQGATDFAVHLSIARAF